MPEGIHGIRRTCTAEFDLTYLKVRVPFNRPIGHLCPDVGGCHDFSELVGQSGTASTQLRPAGIAIIAGKRSDVVTRGDFISAGTHVTVVEVEGARVVVEASDPPDAADARDAADAPDAAEGPDEA